MYLLKKVLKKHLKIVLQETAVQSPVLYLFSKQCIKEIQVERNM